MRPCIAHLRPILLFTVCSCRRNLCVHFRTRNKYASFCFCFGFFGCFQAQAAVWGHCGCSCSRRHLRGGDKGWLQRDASSFVGCASMHDVLQGPLMTASRHWLFLLRILHMGCIWDQHGVVMTTFGANDSACAAETSAGDLFTEVLGRTFATQRRTRCRQVMSAWQVEKSNAGQNIDGLI
jgi:hypothetical protein